MPKSAKQQLQPGAHQFAAAPTSYLAYSQEALQHATQAAWPYAL